MSESELATAFSEFTKQICYEKIGGNIRRVIFAKIYFLIFMTVCTIVQM